MICLASYFNVQLLHYRFSQEILSLELHSWNTCRPRVSRDPLGSDILQKPRGLCLGLVKSSQEETDKTEKHEHFLESHNGEYIYSKHRTQHYVILIPFLVGLLWNGAKFLNWRKRTMFELARSTAAFSVVLWGRGQYQMWDLFEHV